MNEATGFSGASRHGFTLATLIEHAEAVPQIRRVDIREGDFIIVKTRNSVYTMEYVGRNVCRVSGGWFDRRGKSPMRTTIAGCTWGGSVIKVDMLAAIGLRIEFGNRLITTEARRIILLRKASMN